VPPALYARAARCACWIPGRLKLRLCLLCPRSPQNHRPIKHSLLITHYSRPERRFSPDKTVPVSSPFHLIYTGPAFVYHTAGFFISLQFHTSFALPVSRPTPRLCFRDCRSSAADATGLTRHRDRWPLNLVQAGFSPAEPTNTSRHTTFLWLLFISRNNACIVARIGPTTWTVCYTSVRTFVDKTVTGVDRQVPALYVPYRRATAPRYRHLTALPGAIRDRARHSLATPSSAVSANSRVILSSACA